MQVAKKIFTELSDVEIIRKSQEQIDYFACLYERYEKRLLRYIKRIGHVTDEEAEDILQESFVKIWKNLHAFDEGLKLSSWLYRIVHNQAISTLRKKKSFGKDRQEIFDENRYMAISDPSPSEDQVSEERDRCIHKIINELPIHYREVMILKFLENMSYEEISDVLKIPEGTVAIRINRAKKAFRKHSVHCPSLCTL